jgi:hypothetical protein
VARRLLRPHGAAVALLVAEAFDWTSTPEWKALTGPNADEKVRDAMRQEYLTSVLPKFVKRNGWTPPRQTAVCTHPGPLYPLPSRW